MTKPRTRRNLGAIGVAAAILALVAVVLIRTRGEDLRPLESPHEELRLPEAVPGDFPLPSGAILVNSLEEGSSTASWEVAGTVASVRSFYEAARFSTWTRGSTTELGHASLTTLEPSDSSSDGAELLLTPLGDQTLITLTINVGESSVASDVVSIEAAQIEGLQRGLPGRPGLEIPPGFPIALVPPKSALIDFIDASPEQLIVRFDATEIVPELETFYADVAQGESDAMPHRDATQAAITLSWTARSGALHRVLLVPRSDVGRVDVFVVVMR